MYLRLVIDIRVHVKFSEDSLEISVDNNEVVIEMKSKNLPSIEIESFVTAKTAQCTLEALNNTINFTVNYLHFTELKVVSEFLEILYLAAL